MELLGGERISQGSVATHLR